MKIVKIILIVIVVIVAIPLVGALFIKGDYAVERETTVKKSKAVVFDYVKHIKNQNNYSVWNMKDPHSKMEYKGEDGTVGFVSSWDSDSADVGKGEQEITKIADGSRVDMELRFKKPFEQTDYAYMTTDMVDSTQTKVVWGFNGTMKYPFNFMCLFMDMDKMLGPDLQKGLDNMKAIVEKQ